MNRLSYIPFDPDAVTVQSRAAQTPAPLEAAPRLLSEIIADMPETAPNEEPDNAHGPGTSRPLNRKEKWQLSSLAKETHTLLSRLGLLNGEKEKDFRHRVSIAACGRQISEAVFSDRMVIQAAFLKLKGDHAAAHAAQVKAVNTAADIARHAVAETCKKRGYPQSYAAWIALRFFKRPLSTLSAREVWKINFTLINNANARDGKGNAANRFKKLKAQRQTAKSQTKSL